jgi:hypothetical protein
MATSIELEPVIYGRLQALRRAESQLTSQFERLHSAPSKARAGFVSSLAELKMQAARLERFLDIIDQPR